MSLKRFPAQMLLDYQNTVNRIHDADKGLYMLLFRSIRQWYNDNGGRLESLKDRIKALQKEFVKFKMVKSKNKKGEEIEVEGDEMIIIPEKEITIPAVFKREPIPNKWYQFGPPKAKEVQVEPAKTKTIPREVVFKDGKNQEEFDKRYQALVDAEVEIKF
jgi:hypothetical protein